MSRGRLDIAGYEAAGGYQSVTQIAKKLGADDVLEVLGVSASASSETIRSAYRARMKEYHPDKVAHLGEELQKLAHEKSQQFQRAYRQLQS